MNLSRSISVLAAAAALAFVPLQGRAQAAGPFLGLGVGAGRIAEPEANAARLAPSAQLRAGWRMSPHVALMLDGTLNGIGSPSPDAPLFDAGINGGSIRNWQLQTAAVLASVQLSAGGWHLRPGVGVAQHTYTVFRPAPADGYLRDTGHEAKFAAGVAAGRSLNIPGFPLTVEAAALWSRGHGLSGPRWSTGIQLVHDFQL
jgi:hypothetical protein